MAYNRAKDLFSPIYVNADFLETDKTSALYKFATIFFPSMGPGILNILLDMEKYSNRVIASVGQKERENLIKELEGVTVEIRYIVKDRGKDMMAIPINISPAEVLKNATSGRGSRYNKKMQEEIDKMIDSFVKKEIQHRIKTKIEDFLKGLLAKPKIPDMVKELLGIGYITKEGLLAEGTTIEDLISGKYKKLFDRIVPSELVSETLMIKDTISAYYNLEDKDYKSLANEILREKGILEITLGEINGK